MKRIAFIAELIKNYQCPLDVGTDHGLVLKTAFEKKYITKALASDINIKPLKQAQKNLQKYPVTFFLTDGLKNINLFFDAVILTGIGYQKIINILTFFLNNNYKNKESIEFLIGPNHKIELIRMWLNNNYFQIIDEFVIYDKFFYFFLKIKFNNKKNFLKQEDIFLGPVLKNNSLAITFYKQELIKIKKKTKFNSFLKTKEENYKKL